jgi:hypothetical protein
MSIYFKCGERHIDRLLLFDNNGDSLINKFDNKKSKLNKEEFIQLIKTSFGLIKDDYHKKYLKYKNKYLTLKNI